MVLAVFPTATGMASAPPPTPAPITGSPSPFPTILHTPARKTSPPRPAATQAILEDLETGQILFSKRADGRHPIASLTKIMTAQLVIRALSPASPVPVSREAAAASGSSLGLRPGERLQASQLLYGLLLQSSNDAAVALAEAVSGTAQAFVGLMNRRAGAIGLHDTKFASPSGLDDRGFSSARDLATLTRHAFGLPLFAGIIRTKFHDIPGIGGRTRTVENRNSLLWLYPGAIGVKTGFTTPAGYCLVAAAHRGSRSLVAVVLGDPSDEAMFDDAATLLNYGFRGFVRHALVSAGEPVGTVSVGGRVVPAEAGGDLVRLVRGGVDAAVTRSVGPAPGLHLPIHQGDRVGRVVVRWNGQSLGAAPAVAAADIEAPGPVPGPPATSATTLLRVLLAALRLLLGPFL